MYAGLRRAAIRFALLIGLTMPAAAAAVPPNADPFAGMDVVKLFARTPGTVAQDDDGRGPIAFTSARWGISGRPDRDAARSGRVAGGTWVLVVPFIGAYQALIYAATPRGIVPGGALSSPTDRMRAGIANGRIVQRFPVYPPLGSCRVSGQEIRTFGVRDGVLHQLDRRTQPADVRVTLDSPLPQAFDRHDVDALAARTPGLYRQCFAHPTGRPERPFYRGDRGELFGYPDAGASVTFRAGGATFVAVAFRSGGSGGVFTAAVYRGDRGHAEVVHRIESGGRLNLRVRGNALEAATPWYAPGEGMCCFAHVRVVTYRYDVARSRLAAVRLERRATRTYFAEPR